MQDWKMMDKVAGVEFAGLENDGQIPPMRLCPSFSSPANSTPCFWMVRHFPVLQIPVTRHKHRKMVYFDPSGSQNL